MAARGGPGAVTEMLEKAGSTDTRPDSLAEGFGIVDGEYRLSAVQAQAILDLRLHRLTGLEQDKILKEYKEILDKIKELLLLHPNTTIVTASTIRSGYAVCIKPIPTISGAEIMCNPDTGQEVRDIINQGDR